jgi:hypothetical protein
MSVMSTTTAVRLRDVAAGLVTLDARLDQLAALPENWDGHGAARVDPDVIRAVREWGPGVPGWAFAPAPAVVPLSSGAVQLEWRSGTRLLELEFESPGRVHFLRWDPANGVEDEDTFPVADRARAEALIAWAVAGAG